MSSPFADARRSLAMGTVATLLFSGLVTIPAIAAAAADPAPETGCSCRARMPAPRRSPRCSSDGQHVAFASSEALAAGRCQRPRRHLLLDGDSGLRRPLLGPGRARQPPRRLRGRRQRRELRPGGQRRRPLRRVLEHRDESGLPRDDARQAARCTCATRCWERPPCSHPTASSRTATRPAPTSAKTVGSSSSSRRRRTSSPTTPMVSRT